MSLKLKTFLFSSLALAGCIPLLSLSPKSSTAKETGPAKFLRDHDAAMAQAKKSGKPVFAFFQEVPG